MYYKKILLLCLFLAVYSGCKNSTDLPAPAKESAPIYSLSFADSVTHTNTSQIRLIINFEANGRKPEQMYLTEKFDFTDVSPVPFSEESDFTISPGEGAKTIQVKFSPPFDNLEPAKNTIVFDQTLPIVEIYTPTDTKIMPYPNFFLIGKIFDLNLKKFFIIIDGNPQEALEILDNTDGSYIKEIGLPDGEHTLKLKGIDRAGNEAESLLVNITIDSLPPQIFLKTPQNFSQLNQLKQNLTAVIDDPKIKTATLIINGNSREVEVTEGNISTEITLSEGNNTLRIDIRDTAQNYGSTEDISLYVDSLPPQIKILSPENNSILLNSEVNINGRISDEILLGSITKFTITLDQGEPENINITVDGNFTLDKNLPAGNHHILLNATDSLGNSSSAELSLNLNVPLVKIDSPQAGEFFSTKNIAVSGTIDDTQISQATIFVNNIGEAFDLTDGKFTRNVVLKERANSIYVSALNVSGAKGNSSELKIFLDTQGPIPSELTLNAGATLTLSPTIGLDVAAIDETSPVTEMFISNRTDFSTGSWETYVRKKSWSLENGDGEKNICIKFKDKLDNVSSSLCKSITLDTTPPVTTATPEGTGFIAPPEIILSANEKVRNIYYTSDGSTPDINSPVYSAPIPIPESGATLKFFSIDLIGNSEPIKTEGYKPDKENPLFTGLSSMVIINSNSIKLNWAKAIDDVSPENKIRYQICQSTENSLCSDNFTATYTTAPGVTSYDILGIPAANTYYFVVRALDQAGKTDANTKEFFYNAPGRTVGGTISQNTIWALTDSPFYLSENIFIPEGITLTLEPGVTVQLPASVEIQIKGTIIAEGSSTLPITFTAAIPNNNSGSVQLHFLSGNMADSRLKYLKMEWADQAILIDPGNSGVLTTENMSLYKNTITSLENTIILNQPTITESILKGNFTIIKPIIDQSTLNSSTEIIIREGKINNSKFDFSCCSQPGFRIENSEIANTNISGLNGQLEITGSTLNKTPVNLSFGTLSVLNSTINNQESTGLKFDSGSVRFSQITGNSKGTGIEVMGKGEVVISNNEISGQAIGIKLSGNNSLTIRNNIFSGNTLYHIQNSTASDFSLPANYWGTTDENQIGLKIYDYTDNKTTGKITFTPLLSDSDITIPINTSPNNFIKGEIKITNSPSITLTLSATDNTGITGYYISENSTEPSPDAAEWAPVSPNPTFSEEGTFNLSNSSGTKSLFLWFKDKNGNISVTAQSSIILDLTPPQIFTTFLGGGIQGATLYPDNIVTTLAGNAGKPGSTNGPGQSAKFNFPQGITTDGSNIFIADSNNHIIRKTIIATGETSDIAGSSGEAGTADGVGSQARFNYPYGITTDGTNLYVADTFNHTIRKIVIATGEVSTLAGTPGLVFNPDTAENYNINGIGSAARFAYPEGITTDGTNLYVADAFNNRIRKIVISTGTVSTFAGKGNQAAQDGIGVQASFYWPFGITTDGTNLFVTDLKNHKVRKIIIATTQVITLAGKEDETGSIDGPGTTARFNSPEGIITDGTNLYVTDSGNHTLRKIAISTGEVSTLAGTATQRGSIDATGTNARFFSPNGVTTDGLNLFIADTENQTIRKIGNIGNHTQINFTPLTPLPGERSVDVNTVIKATFSKPIDPLSVNETSFQVKDAGNNVIGGVIGFIDNTITFTPSAALIGNTDYTVTLTTGIKDFLGNALENEFSWTFKTL